MVEIAVLERVPTSEMMPGVSQLTVDDWTVFSIRPAPVPAACKYRLTH